MSGALTSQVIAETFPTPGIRCSAIVQHVYKLCLIPWNTLGLCTVYERPQHQGAWRSQLGFDLSPSYLWARICPRIHTSFQVNGYHVWARLSRDPEVDLILRVVGSQVCIFVSFPLLLLLLQQQDNGTVQSFFGGFYSSFVVYITFISGLWPLFSRYLFHR